MLKIQFNDVVYEVDPVNSVSSFRAIEQQTGKVVQDVTLLANLFITARRVDYLQKAISPINGFLYALRDGAIQEQDALQLIVQQETYASIFSATSSLFLNYATGSLTKTEFLTEIGKHALALDTHSAKRFLLLATTEALYNQANASLLEAYQVWPQLQQPDRIIDAAQVEQATALALTASEHFLLRTGLITSSQITQSEGFWSDYLDFWAGVGATLLPEFLKTKWALTSDAFKNIEAVTDVAEQSLKILDALEWGSARAVDLTQYLDLLQANTTPAIDQQTLINQEGFEQILTAFIARELETTSEPNPEFSSENAQVLAIGTEILVNEQIEGQQSYQEITTLTNGKFVITWFDQYHGIKAQILNPDGTKLGGEITVNNQRANYWDKPEIAALTDGGFAITWGDSIGGDILAKVYDHDGSVRSDEIIVDTSNLSFGGGNYYPEITSLSGGGFAIAWLGYPEYNWTPPAIEAQVFNPDGSRSGNKIYEFLSDNSTFRPGELSYAGDNNQLEITDLADGNFAIAWEEWSNDFPVYGEIGFNQYLAGVATGELKGSSVKASFFSVDGTRLFSNTFSGDSYANFRFNPEIMVDSHYSAMIGMTELSLIGDSLWTTYIPVSGISGHSTDETNLSSIFMSIVRNSELGFGVGQIGDDDYYVHTAEGSIFLNGVYLTSPSGGFPLQLTVLSDGNFVVTWTDYWGGSSGYELKAQAYNPNGQTIGDVIHVNTATQGDQSNPKTTALPNGGFAITWEDWSRGVGGATGDHSSSAIKAQVFAINNGTVSSAWQITPNNPVVSEAGGTIEFTITRPIEHKNTKETVFVSTTQTHGTKNENDYLGLLNQEIIFSAGELTKQISVTLLPDDIAEDNETFGLIVQTNATDPVWVSLASTTFTIQDNPVLSPSEIMLEYFAKGLAYDPRLANPNQWSEIESHWGDLGYTLSEVFIDGTFLAVGLTGVNQEPVLAFRGTTDFSDWKPNFDLRGVGYTEFDRAWNNPSAGIKNGESIESWLAKNPGTNITGHSQGGAQAQLLAARVSALNDLRLAPDEKIIIGDIVTFNSPGISFEDARKFDANSAHIGKVKHVVSSGDVVQLVGESLIEGEVFVYNFEAFEGGIIRGTLPFSLVTSAHTGHWSNLSNYLSPFHGEGFRFVENYEPAYVDIDIADYNSPGYSYLFSGGKFDYEYFYFLLGVASLGPATWSLGLPAGSAIAHSLMTRGTAEKLRADYGPGLYELFEKLGSAWSGLLEAIKDIPDVLFEAISTVFSWSISALNALKDWTIATWEGISSWTAETWQAAREWVAESWTAISQWTADTWEGTKNWTVETWQKAKDWPADFWEWSVTNVKAFFNTINNAIKVDSATQVTSPFKAWEAFKGSSAGQDYLSQNDSAVVIPDENGKASAIPNMPTILYGTANSENFFGGSSNDLILGGNGNNLIHLWSNNPLLISPLNQTETVENRQVEVPGIMSQGGDIVTGTVSELNGDTVFGFANDDVLFVAGAFFSQSDLRVSKGSAILQADVDQDGEIDFMLTLKGEYALNGFVVEAQETGTVIRYTGYLGPVLNDDEGEGFATDAKSLLITPDVRANDLAFDGGVIDIIDFDSSGLSGLLTYLGDGQFGYDPAGAFNHLDHGEQATEIFTYRAVDATGIESTATVTITINGVNDVPDVELVTVRIGDAPARVTSVSQLVDAWSDSLLGSIAHKSDSNNVNEIWSLVTLGTSGSQALAGGDLYAGDLGVSGRSVTTSTVAQELDGNEALRFEFTEAATAITVNLSRLYSNDTGSGYNESGRMRLFDADGYLVGETTFAADALNGQKTISLASDTPFTAVEFNAGAYVGDQFIFGALAASDGTFGSAIHADAAGKLHGSDFLIDWIEPTFEISLVGQTPDLIA